MATSAAGRYCIVIVRQCGTRCYSNGHGAPTAKMSIFGRIDAKIEQILPTKLKPLWNHEAGMKTIHFWAPAFKWVLVFAGLADYARPPEKLSLQQSAALTATGVVWARWALIITPKNYSLASVNVFVGLTGCMQLMRISLYYRSLRLAQHAEDLEASGGMYLPPDIASQQPYF